MSNKFNKKYTFKISNTCSKISNEFNHLLIYFKLIKNCSFLSVEISRLELHDVNL